ncbi:hypothetical protein [Erythrobacter sp.]|uniref:hypothetical protein n=1 Tax=Erythrobacter sp. TaxID=1042 RepID=UPI001425F909|nr:hypothetical protein [Erythrobacter sp.]QIQ86984.1 MAG: hypothetical protein G9473_10010 [Erythrobacter sp.]
MPLTFTKLAAPALGALLLLSACEEEAEAPRETAQGGEAAGEVLGGTISDDMLPLERLRSQSPPMERETSPGDRAEGGDEGDAVEADGAQEGDETPAPAPVPAPQPSPSPAATGLPVAPPVED